MNPRDEIFHYRLSSFLSKEGGLDVQRFSKIKSTIYQIETKSGEKYVLKGHYDLERVKRQWAFFEKIPHDHIVPFTLFPNKKKMLVQKRMTWTISPYIKGRQLRYRNEEDRLTALKAVKAFHRQARRIHLPLYAKDILLVDRMKKRCDRFAMTAGIFREFGYGELFHEIYQTSAGLLKLAAQFPWNQRDSLAKRQGLWIHGDVASHNFIVNKKAVLIDFDLLSSAPQLYDYIQLGQRFLPFISWDLRELMKYDMVPEADLDIWLIMMALPSDVMREWLIVSDKSNSLIDAHLQQMREEWDMRKIFLRNVKTVLQSK